MSQAIRVVVQRGVAQGGRLTGNAGLGRGIRLGEGEGRGGEGEHKQLLHAPPLKVGLGVCQSRGALLGSRSIP